MGSLKLIIGPMFAGKSSELIKIINQYKVINKNIMVINHSLNCRYGSENLTTHDRNELKGTINIDKLSRVYGDKTIYDYYKKSDVIIVEELQFFPDAFDNILLFVEQDKKTVVCASLDGDSNRKPFGDVLKLIPYAEEVKKINALCRICSDGTKASFTKRYIRDNSEQTLVGDGSIYEAVCRKHYLE